MDAALYFSHSKIIDMKAGQEKIKTIKTRKWSCIETQFFAQLLLVNSEGGSVPIKLGILFTKIAQSLTSTVVLGIK